MLAKDHTLATVRGLAIILVIYGHVIQRSILAAGGDFFASAAFKAVYAFHMPLFFFISGYSIVFSLGRKSILDVFKARCRSLLVPYAIWGALGVMTMSLLDVIAGKAVNILHWPVALADELLWHPVIWFLFTLFAACGLLLSSIKLQERLGLWAFALVYLGLMGIASNQSFALYYVQWFYLFYLAGYLFNRYGPVTRDWRMRPVVFAGVLFAFTALVLLWGKNDYIYVNRMIFTREQFGVQALRLVYRYCAGGLGIALIFHIGAYLARTRVQAFLIEIGVYSLGIYLLQRYIVEGLYARLAGRMPVGLMADTWSLAWFLAPAATLVFVCLCWSLVRALTRRDPVLGAVLFGR